MTSIPSAEVQAYLSGLPEEQREALSRLRQFILSVVPSGEDCIGYKMPAIRFEGRILVYYAAAKKHCSLFPASAAAVHAFSWELKAYSVGKGRFRFQPQKPLPGELLRRLIEFRVREIRAKSGRKLA